MNDRSLTLIALFGVALSGCASNSNMPLIFGQSQTVGISIGASANVQGADFVLGYKDKNIAIVPIAISDTDGNFSWVGSTSGDGFEDAFSVLGQFEVSSDTTQGNVGLGKFFATGSAAKALADGFSCKLSGPQAVGCGPGQEAADSDDPDVGEGNDAQKTP